MICNKTYGNILFPFIKFVLFIINHYLCKTTYIKSMRLITYILSIMLLFLCWSCKESDDIKETLISMQKNKICLSLDRMQCKFYANDTTLKNTNSTEFCFVVYIDSARCSPCTLDKIHQWNILIDEFKQRKEQKLEFIFIAAPKPSQIEDAYLSIEYCGLKNPIYVDTAYIFRENNKHIPSETRYHNFLINSKGEIMLVGNPLENKKIRNLLNKLTK